MVRYILNINLAIAVKYQVSVDEDLSNGRAEFLVRGERNAFCEFNSGLDNRLSRFAEGYGLPLERVNVWLALVKEGKVSSVTTWDY